MPFSQREQRVCAWIAANQAQLRADLHHFVSIPTGWNYTKGLDEFRHLLARRLENLGAVVEYHAGDPRPAWLAWPSSGEARCSADIPPVLIGRCTGDSNKRILIVGHLDTVHDPHGAFRELKLEQRGAHGVGPGAVDMKGGIVIGLCALEALRACGANISWTCALNSDEETGSFHSTRILRSEAKKHHVGVVLEPAAADGGLVIERMGSGSFQVEIAGKSAHVGRDFKNGVSAVLKLAEVMCEIGKLSDPERGKIVNIGPIVGGGATNVVADHAACWGNMRFSDAKGAQDLVSRLEGIASGGGGLPGVVVRTVVTRPAKAPTEAVLQMAGEAQRISQDLGLAMPLVKTGGVCDGNLLQEEGLPTIDTLGVRGGNLHRDDEYAELDTIVQRCQLLAVFLMRMSV